MPAKNVRGNCQNYCNNICHCFNGARDNSNVLQFKGSHTFVKFADKNASFIMSWHLFIILTDNSNPLSEPSKS